MKHSIIAGVALLLAGHACAQGQAIYENKSDLAYGSTPPQIAATAFVNSALFSVGYSAWSSVGGVIVQDLPFETLYTLYYTNKTSGTMEGYPGFRFDFTTNNAPSTMLRYPAANFHNQGKIYGSTWLKISATNIYSPGPMSVGEQGLLQLNGQRVDLSRSTLRAGRDPQYPEYDYGSGMTLGGTYENSRGVTDLYWSVGKDGTLSGTNGADFNLPILRQQYFETPGAGTPSHQILQISSLNRIMTNGASLPDYFTGSYYNYDAYAVSNWLSRTSSIIQVVFAPTNNYSLATGITAQVRFLGGGYGYGTAVPAIELRSTYYDPIDQTNRADLLYLLDYMAQSTNYNLSTGRDPMTLNSTGTRRPNVYEVSTSEPYSWNYAGGPNIAYTNVSFYHPDSLTNAASYTYAAYSALLNATNDMFFSGPSPVQPADPTTASGRVEINAGTLNLQSTRIHAENYLSITTTNLINNTLAIVDAPFIKYDLGTTQSVLTISNLVAPTYHRLSGQLMVWSAVWTNQFAVSNAFTGVVETNQTKYHVMFVDYLMQPDVAVNLYDLAVRGTNVVLYDSIVVMSNLVVDAKSLTIATRGGTNASLTLPYATGWSPANFPRLLHLTNNGDILISTAGDFSLRLNTNNYYGQPVTLDLPYLDLINSGYIAGASLDFHASNFVNSGQIIAQSGIAAFRLTNGLLSGGSISARSDVQFTAANLSATGSVIDASGALTLDVTNHLTDGGAGANNDWQVSDGFLLARRPQTGDLLGTKITSRAAYNTLVRHVWGGQNRGVGPAGYSNNAAVGHLVLDGASRSLFQFAGAGVSNALYVDYLEFRNFTTNVLSALEIDPGFILYFANANLSPDKLNGAFQGRLLWVYNYAGPMSTTNVLLDGSYIAMNLPLMQSTYSDLDGDGLPNKVDTEPLFSATQLDFRSQFLPTPSPRSELSWYAIRYSTNRVEYRTDVAATNWFSLTNIIQGSVNGRLTVADPVKTGSQRYYRVRLDPYIGLGQP